MRICPKCQHPSRESERIEKDPHKNRYWLITYCARCGFNHDLTIYAGDIKSPQEELDVYPEIPKKPWGYGL